MTWEHIVTIHPRGIDDAQLDLYVCNDWLKLVWNNDVEGASRINLYNYTKSLIHFLDRSSGLYTQILEAIRERRPDVFMRAMLESGS